MSLKTFHIFFVLLSIVLAGCFGVWGIENGGQENAINLWMGAGSIAGGVALICYLIWFLKKSHKFNKHLLILAVISAWFLFSNPLWACAVCFGNPDAPITKGAVAGVVFLLGVVGIVLGGILAVALTWIRRAEKLAAGR